MDSYRTLTPWQHQAWFSSAFFQCSIDYVRDYFKIWWTMCIILLHNNSRKCIFMAFCVENQNFYSLFNIYYWLQCAMGEEQFTFKVNPTSEPDFANLGIPSHPWIVEMKPALPEHSFIYILRGFLTVLSQSSIWHYQ